MRSAIDWVLAVPIGLLASLSIVMLVSISPQLIGQQVFAATLALVLYLGISRINGRVWQSVALHLYGASVLLLFFTLLFGVASRGSVRWLEILGTRIQSSEVVRPLLLVAFAGLLSRFPPNQLKNVCINSIFVFIPFWFVFRQPDLGSALVIITSWVGMLFIAGIRLRLLLVALSGGFLTIPWLWNHLADYQKQRVLVFLNPASDPLGSGYSMIQSIIAVGSGQLMGRGLGRGVQSQLQFLPEHYTDFIFASLGEELGFFGSLAVICFLAVIIGRCFYLAHLHTDPFGRLFVTGAAVMLLFQTVVNIGMNMGLVPITGITLPFVSYGGSSMIGLALTLGIVSSLRSIIVRSVDTNGQV